MGAGSLNKLLSLWDTGSPFPVARLHTKCTWRGRWRWRNCAKRTLSSKTEVGFIRFSFALFVALTETLFFAARQQISSTDSRATRSQTCCHAASRSRLSDKSAPAPRLTTHRLSSYPYYCILSFFCTLVPLAIGSTSLTSLQPQYCGCSSCCPYLYLLSLRHLPDCCYMHPHLPWSLVSC